MTSSPRRFGNGYHGSIASRSPGRKRFPAIELRRCQKLMLSDYPFAQIDGGGAFSHPDWSQDHRQEHDWFKTLRTSWMNRIISERLDKILLAHVASGNPSPPFSMEILTPFRKDLEQFLLSHKHQPDWSIRQHQPMHLHILHSLQRSCTTSILHYYQVY